MRPHALSALLLASLPLAACSPAPAPPAMPGGNAAGSLPAAAPPPATGRAATPAASVDAAPAAEGASIAGAIHDGNRAPPALRVCAHPLDGGKPRCLDTAPGATAYRLALAPGRYVVVAQAKDDPGVRFAHASRIRCIRAPCPPDTLVELSLAPGEALAGIDLTAGAAEPPAAADG